MAGETEQMKGKLGRDWKKKKKRGEREGENKDDR